MGAAFVYTPQMADHVLRDDHPMRPVRLRYTFDLLQAYGAFDGDGAMLVSPRPASEDEVLSFHTRPYIDAVRRYGEGGDARDHLNDWRSSAQPFNAGMASLY